MHPSASLSSVAGPRSRLVAGLRSGGWLTAERIRVYPTLLGSALLVTVAALVATSHDGLDVMGRPLGVDFSGVWVAGREVLAGHPAAPYDNAVHAAAQTAAFGASGSYLPWPYPPYFLAAAALAGCLPYFAALAAWQGATLAVYLAAVGRAAAGAAIGRARLIVAALAFPAVAINLVHGQNGCLSAGLLAFGALLLPQRPIVAGLLFGVLAYKPQFAIAVPFALVAGGYWWSVAAAALTVAAETGAAWLAFGSGPWRGFFDGLAFTRRVILEQGGLESWKLQSAFAAIRLWGGSTGLAYAVQGMVTFGVLATLVAIWRAGIDHRDKVAALCLAALLGTPYAVDYDMAVLGPALAALLASGLDRGFPAWRKTSMALCWAMPLAARLTAMTVHIPLGLLAMAALFASIAASAHATGRRFRGAR